MDLPWYYFHFRFCLGATKTIDLEKLYQLILKMQFCPDRIVLRTSGWYAFTEHVWASLCNGCWFYVQFSLCFFLFFFVFFTLSSDLFNHYIYFHNASEALQPFFLFFRERLSYKYVCLTSGDFSNIDSFTTSHLFAILTEWMVNF
jgi:hypothetical protein